MPKQVVLNRLLESVGRGVDPLARANIYGIELFADSTGYHIYGELMLALRLTAAEDTSDAQRLLRILQEYTLIAEACAAESSSVLLEVQGELLHLFMPKEAVNADSVEELLRFCMALANEVNSRISKAAGKDYQGFKLAADHGRAIMLSTGGQANGSVVSLGPAANAPAKQLKKNGVSGYLRLRANHYAARVYNTVTEGWVNVPMLKPTLEMAQFASAELINRFATRSTRFIEEGTRTPSSVQFADQDFLNSLTSGYVKRALKVQGFVLRADLDGFSKDVEKAFANGHAAVLALVGRFFMLMRFPVQFRQRVGKTIDLPWAGDCANLIVLPNGVPYATAREYLPVKAAAEWHTQSSENDPDKKRWSSYLVETRWSVCVAGGDEQEGSNGIVLVAPIAGRARDFVVAAGWGVGRSLDGQETDGVKGGDTVVPNIDYVALDDGHKVDFKKLNTLFWVANGLTAASLRSAGIRNLTKSSPVIVPSVSRVVPQPRPFWHGKA